MDIRIERSHKRRKTISIYVRDGAVVARVPHHVSDHYVHDLIREREAWIQTQIEKQQNQPLPPTPKAHWQAGEAVPFLGEPHILTQDHSKQELYLWYRKQAKTILIERTAHFAVEMNLYPNKVVVKPQKARWGSCSIDNVIRLNWKVIQAPLDLVDYLIVHELAHIQEKNHGPQFWALVAQFIENHLDCRKALQHFGRYSQLNL
ncbi:MAG: SprT family zinc-dependent metalloprotease [Gammaproteobacteria bacterium]|nr:SprT family zinc-dependent metalloprotease [Gammaproteobacteria bacterium]